MNGIVGVAPQPVWDCIANKLKSQAAVVAAKMMVVLNKIWSVVSKILIALVSIAFFLLAPYFFAAGAIVGFVATVIAPQHVPRIMEAVKGIFTKLPFIPLALFGIGAFFALPITLATTSVLCGAYVGNLLSTEVQRLINKKAPAKEAKETAASAQEAAIAATVEDGMLEKPAEAESG